ncbi:MAG: hypothetical protein IT423_18395 [Pirellulaceae bacterium]|nr:hypothetical protein [Pirellulaceae bacterium]
MKLRMLDILLILATVIGAITLARSSLTLQSLKKEQARIDQAVGHLEITDKTKIHIVAIDSGDPWQWAWRVYLPSFVTGSVITQNGTGSSSHGFGSGPQEFVARCSLTQTQSGTVGLYLRFINGSTYSSMGTPEFYQFLKTHRQKLQIEQLGSDGVVQLVPGAKSQTLLRLRLPDDLAAVALKQFSQADVRAHLPLIIEAQIQVH